MEKIKAHIDKLKFTIVGGANTLIDFVILNVLNLLLGVPSVFANFVSTGVAMIFSYIVNKKWTFNSKSKKYLREVVLFIVFTVIGMWVVNSGILALLISVLPTELDEFWKLNIAKLCATIASMIWNYIVYKRIVFKGDQKKQDPKDD